MFDSDSFVLVNSDMVHSYWWFQMSKVVKIGYADYMDKDGELTVLRLVELRVHVYREDTFDWDPPFWSVWYYYDEEGKEWGDAEYYKDFETADLRFHDCRPLCMCTVGTKCPECGHMEAMYRFFARELFKREMRCMDCGFVWDPP